eukprot:15367048-Ditylum_brightwellii.AAC.2
MALDLCCLMLLLMIQCVVELSTWIGVGGWGWPISVRATCIAAASFAFSTNAPSSASAADAITLHRAMCLRERLVVWEHHIVVFHIGAANGGLFLGWGVGICGEHLG